MFAAHEEIDCRVKGLLKIHMTNVISQFHERYISISIVYCWVNIGLSSYSRSKN